MEGTTIKKIFNKFIVIFLLTMGAFYFFDYFVGGAYQDLAKQLGIVNLESTFALWFLIVFGLKMPANPALPGAIILFLVNFFGTLVIFFTGFLMGLRRFKPGEYSRYIVVWMGAFLSLEVIIPTIGIIFTFIGSNVLGLGLFPYTVAELSRNFIEAMRSIDLVRIVVLATGIFLFTIIKQRRPK